MSNPNRRNFLIASGTLLASASGGIPAALAEAAAVSPAVSFLDKSELIYLCPLLSSGSESRCHGEVWFVHHNAEVFVVTKSDAWRTEAIRQGLNRASIWIGEFGAWKSAKDRYRSAPFLNIEGSIEDDTAMHTAVLTNFAHKYAAEWGTWGPRFSKGLASGDRVMLRYRVVS